MKLLFLSLLIFSNYGYAMKTEVIEVTGPRLRPYEFHEMVSGGDLAVGQSLGGGKQIGRRNQAPDPIPSDAEGLSKLDKEKKLELSDEAFVYIIDRFFKEGFDTLKAIFDRSFVSDVRTTETIFNSKGEKVKEKETRHCLSINASNACTKMVITHHDGTMIIKFQPLVPYEFAEGVYVLGTFTREARYILVDDETGPEIEMIQLFSTGEFVSFNAPCFYPERAYQPGETTHKYIDNGIQHYTCSYASLAVTEVNCDDGYEEDNTLCAPKRCNGYLHGIKKLDSESRCRNGRKQLTYKTCNYGDWKYSYRSISCRHGETPSPSLPGCGSIAGCLDPEA